MATRSNRLVPARAIHPGEILREELQERSIKQKDFARAIGVQATHLNEFIKGKRNLNGNLAMKLESQLGIPFRTWMNLHNGYIYERKVLDEKRSEKLYSFDEMLDKHIGETGTPERDRFEMDVDAAVHAYNIGETIRKARLEQNLTQEELGERVGIKKAQISRIEKGCSITIPTMSRIFRALGIVTASLDLGKLGKVALW